MAQQPEEQQSPKEKKGAEKTHAAEAKPGTKAAKPEATAAKQTGAMKERSATTEPGAGKGRKARATEKSATSPGTETNVSGDPSAEYYAYDGPIYVGHRAEPPDQVIADVQAELQQMGYYKGEVDGLLGPLTRQALTAYQADQGLTVTAAIDEPTLDSLEMG